MQLSLRGFLLGGLLLVTLSGCIRNVSRHPIYQPLVGEAVILDRDLRAGRQSGNLFHWDLPSYALNGASGDAILWVVPWGTEVRIQSFQRRTWFIGIPTDFAIVEVAIPDADERVEADIRVAQPSVQDGGVPDFPWQNTER